ncbi:ferric-rhodotorulic acid outer membrane transporter [Salmonella enterica subsp. enterica]|uniref:Ferric-rhodotorulic acid outer membrane transporter n=1 Tax=Salmonella enterica I TaxID=59201 RepID=A0A3S4F7J5_SALET|nr:ferric-rhodotorulic acid outer membrane transporter [Salmonella enterica subsp. enterica]
MIRKHATSREFKGNVSTEYGSWNKQRYVMDLQSPLTADGNVRGRIVAGYQNNDSWLDRYNSEKAFFSELSMPIWVQPLAFQPVMNIKKLMSIARPGAVCRAGTPMAAKIAMTARVVPPPDWAYNNKEINKFFVTLKQRFAESWQATLNATHTEGQIRQ